MSKKRKPTEYVAKYAVKQGGGLHFGGTLGGVNFSEDTRASLKFLGGEEIVTSVNCEHNLFHMRNPRARRQR
jgi:hypothetical protein